MSSAEIRDWPSLAPNASARSADSQNKSLMKKRKSNFRPKYFYLNWWTSHRAKLWSLFHLHFFVDEHQPPISTYSTPIGRLKEGAYLEYSLLPVKMLTLQSVIVFLEEIFQHMDKSYATSSQGIFRQDLYFSGYLELIDSCSCLAVVTFDRNLMNRDHRKH